jgi:hypothetical protein
METNYNFEEIWKQRKTDIPDIAEILSKSNAYKKKQMLISLLLILALFADFGIVAWVWFSFPELHFLTKAGIMLLVIAIVFFIFQNLQKMKIINKINPATSNQEYLKQMKILQQKDLYLQTKGISIFYIFLSLGIAFYLFEFAERMSVFWGFFTYFITFGWIFFGWFYIRPIKIRKQQKKIQDIISSLEKLEEDFES